MLLLRATPTFENMIIFLKSKIRTIKRAFLMAIDFCAACIMSLGLVTLLSNKMRFLLQGGLMNLIVHLVLSSLYMKTAAYHVTVGV